METSISTENMNPQQALQHLKDVVENVAKDAQSITSKYTSTLLVCFCWKEDDVHGSKDCDDITKVFEEIYGAEVMRVVLEMKKYEPFDVFRMVPDILRSVKKSQLVVLFYRYSLY